jgi:hypothetical protein
MGPLFELSRNAIAVEQGDLLSIALTIGIPIVVAYAVFYFLADRVNFGWPKWLPWLAYIPLLVGVILCWPFFAGAMGWTEQGKYYGDLNDIGSKMIIIHYASVPLQLLAAGGLFVWRWLKSKSSSPYGNI